MIDTVCILFTAFMCIFMTYRAIRLDRSMTWFAGVLPALQAAGAAMIPTGVARLVAKRQGWRERAGAPEPARAAPKGWRGRTRAPEPDGPAPAPRSGRASRARQPRYRTHAS